MYGHTRSPSQWTPEPSVIGEIETSAAGNVILRVGKLHSIGWTQTEHVVLTPDEARALAAEVLAQLGEPVSLRVV